MHYEPRWLSYNLTSARSNFLSQSLKCVVEHMKQLELHLDFSVVFVQNKRKYQ